MREKGDHRTQASPKVAEITPWQTVEDLGRYLEDFYERIAFDLKLDISFVLSAARGECRSKRVERALLRELKRIVDHLNHRPLNPT
jgi:hypothetical protein